MKKTSTKLRFNKTFSQYDVAFERLYIELNEIKNKFKDDPDVIAKEQRKHLRRILYFYSNGRFDKPQT